MRQRAVPARRDGPDLRVSDDERKGGLTSERMAVGPRLTSTAPFPSHHPIHSARKRTGVVVDRDATRVFERRQRVDVPDRLPSLWEPCSDGTFADEGRRVGAVDAPASTAFVVYQAVTCSAIGMGGNVPRGLRRDGRTGAGRHLSAGVERGLAEGIDQSSNPFFGDANVDVLNSGTAVSPGVGLSFLEEAIGTTGRQGMIHATPAVVAALQAIPVGARRGHLETANGTPIVSGMGYQDIDTPFLDTPGATEDWVFATGPVNVYLGPVEIRTSGKCSTARTTY